MSWLDWTILAAYAALLLGIGWHFARKNQSTEDYFMGGRRMSPLLVGLSLFATLVSTLAYLAWPGEIVANGPMLLGAIAAHPLTFLIVGYGLIPLLMKQPVTSAYEILESRLGTSIRKAGAASFLILRLGWMAMMLYATSSLVLVPMWGLSQDWTPWICMIMGLVTVIYSSEGGIRAVVVTDALQSLTMLVGAAVTLAVITLRMGGVNGWWPQQWPSGWPTPTWGFDPSSRLSFGAIVMSTLLWYVCTNGSDQMAIQRFLSTRDASAARKTLAVSLITDVIVTCLLALVGVALFGFYLSHSSDLPAGKSVVGSADQLFSTFIMTEMPAGLAGIVMAAILSAAMSSLSSGINATCAVLDQDFLSGSDGGSASVARMKLLSWAVGIVSVLLSLLCLYIQGNLIERCYKVINLLTAPIFVLFFLALFVPFANATGAWLGLISSILTAVAVAYSDDLGLKLGLSFIWMLPLSLLAGVTAGTLGSFAGNRFRHKLDTP